MDESPNHVESLYGHNAARLSGKQECSNQNQFPGLKHRARSP